MSHVSIPAVLPTFVYDYLIRYILKMCVAIDTPTTVSTNPNQKYTSKF